MFERYTEKARRAIFFGRFEASQYGSSSIEAEHIFLGLLREDYSLIQRFVGPSDLSAYARAEIEKVIKRRKYIPTSVDLPLSTDSKKILIFAAEEADRLGQQYVGTEHILLAILRLTDSLAAKLLVARGAKTSAIREQITKRAGLIYPSVQPAHGAVQTLDGFLRVLRGDDSQRAADFFAERGQFVDSTGKRWIGSKEIDGAAEMLFAPFAKKNIRLFVEDVINGPSETVVASVIWEFATVSSDQSASMLLMSVVLASAGLEWTIVPAQVTPFLPSLGSTV